MLAWERLQRGWSHEELAKRVRVEMAKSGEMETGLTANTVRRWETGQRRPEPRYRKHLVTIFGKPASELGLLSQEELEMRPTGDVAREFGRLVDLISDELGSRSMDRATFLQKLIGAAVTPHLAAVLRPFDEGVVERVARVVNGNVRVDQHAIDAYSEVVARNRTLYWSAPPETMFRAARIHADLGVELLSGARTDAERGRIAAGAAESALLAARVAFFDLQRPAVAGPLLDLALSTSREAGDHQLASAVYAHASFLPGFAGDAPRAHRLTDAARAHARHGVGPVTRAWLHAVSSEIAARTGQPAVCLREIGLAEDSLARSGDEPEWLDFFDAGRLDGFAGYSLLVAGDHSRSTERLDRALAALPAEESKQRAVLLADLAAATAGNGDVEQAGVHLHRAIDSLEQDWYAIGYDRVLDHRHVVSNTDADEMTERLRSLAGQPAAD